LQKQYLSPIEDSPQQETSSKWATFSSIAHIAFTFYCCVAALSIGLSQTILVPLIAYWLYTATTDKTRLYLIFPLQTNSQIQITAAMLFWVLACFISSLVGIETINSIPTFLKLIFYTLLPFCVYSSLTCVPYSNEVLIKKIQTYFFAFILGQTLAGIHTIMHPDLDKIPFLKPPGPLTESGQLVLIIPCVLLLIFHSGSWSRYEKIAGLLVFLGSLVISWHNVLFAYQVPFIEPAIINYALGFIFLCLLLAQLRGKLFHLKDAFVGKKYFNLINFRQTIWLSTIIFFIALFINLKRGPWLGVFLPLIIIGIFLSRKLLITTILLSGMMFLMLNPAYERIVNSSEHFTISGGRKQMWDVGMDLVGHYPLGLGIGNAFFIQEVDPSLPHIHRHLHNNFLNIAVETGVIGLTVFIWWMFAIIYMGFKIWKNNYNNQHPCKQKIAVTAFIISCSILGWQIAGLVEYNFGDSEIRLIAYSLIGILLALGKNEEDKPIEM
jgi:hypothetical protein